MVFNAAEIFEIAINIEINGQKFYSKASEITEDPKVSELLKSLGEMEVSHEEYFRKLKNTFAEKYESEMPDMDEQLNLYLKSYADGKVFSSSVPPEALISQDSTVEEIFETAIDFERKTVVFFTLIREMLPESLDRDKIDILIKEELKHVALLNNQLQAYKESCGNA